MTREELIKKIAKVIESDDYSEDIEPGSGKRWTWWLGEAKAAIDIVLEEAAKIADDYAQSADTKFAEVVARNTDGEKNLELAGAAAIGMDYSSRRIAERIRALKGE